MRLLLCILFVIGYSLFLSYSTSLGGVDYLYEIDYLEGNSKRVYDFFNYIVVWNYSFHMPAFLYCLELFFYK